MKLTWNMKGKTGEWDSVCKSAGRINKSKECIKQLYGNSVICLLIIIKFKLIASVSDLNLIKACLDWD